MPRRKRVRFWSPNDLKQLRRLAGRQSVARISRELKRSEAAVRFKAHTEGISLALR